jgi:hypothetical protein
MRPGLLMLAGGLVAAAALAAMTEAGSLGAIWFRASPGSLNATQAMMQRYLAPALWTDAVVPLLRQPAWLVAGIAGACAALGGILWQKR